MKEENDSKSNQSNLEDFFGGSSDEVEKKATPTSSEVREPIREAPPPVSSKPIETPPNSEEELDFDEMEDIIESVFEEESDDYIVGHRDTPQNLGPSYLLSVDYEGGNVKKAIARLYDPVTKKIYFWYDNTGHKPYCYTDFPPQVVQSKVGNKSGYLGSQVMKVKDLLRDEVRDMTKVIADDPLSIGGRRESIREDLVEYTPDMTTRSHAWEANIRYRNCYTYDRNLVLGLPYKIEDGNLIRCDPKVDEDVLREFKSLFVDNKGLERVIDQYAPMFFTEVPDIRRIAVDIEVHVPHKNRIPDSGQANQQVTAIGLTDNEGLNVCYVLVRENHPKGEKYSGYPKELEVIQFHDEKEMILQAFRMMDKYPVVLTFVGDTFDLKYLYNRAKNLGIDVKTDCPIRMSYNQDTALMRGGIHIDLYRFLKNPSIRLYALSGAYERSNLESIGQGLLGEGKLERSDDINNLPLYELAHYCWLDSSITLRVTSYNENLVLRLIILLMRISRLSMEDVTRFGISSWIQSLFRQEHRLRNTIIPQQWEIQEMKSSVAQTEAMIKDKAFKGAIVIEPVSGVHFNATVLDFASLYPTIMKTHNISYETVDCTHKECQDATDNKVPETNHWICKKNRGMISETIGFFRDTRVNWFKVKSKDKSLNEKIRNWYTVVEKALKVYVNACLPFDEEVVVRDTSGFVSKRKIGSLQTDWQDLEILSVENNWDSPSFGKATFIPIKGFSCTGTASLLNIQLCDGRRIRCTDNHLIPKILPKYERTARKRIAKEPLRLREVAAEDLEVDDDILILEQVKLSDNPPSRLFIPDFIDTSELTIGVKREDYKKFSYMSGQQTDNPLIQVINSEFRYSKGSKWYKAQWDNLSDRAKDCIRSNAFVIIPMYAKLNRRTGRYYESGKWSELSINLDSDFFSFLGWYLSEGYAGTNGISISQYKYQNPENFVSIGSLLTRMQLPFAVHSDEDHVIHSRLLTKVIESLCGNGSSGKRIPIELLNKERARILLDSFFKGDGNFNRHGAKRYSTLSRQLALDLVMILNALGIHTSIHDTGSVYRILETKGLKYQRYGRGSADFNGTRIVRIRSIEREEVEEPVYDIETENGWFVATNGIIVHNSYGVTGAQHFELFCMPAAESVTAYGRNAIVRTKEKAESMGVQVLYGDTDSVFLDAPSKEQQAELIRWSREELGIDLEVEKTYKYVALSDRKKNYIGVYDSGYVEVKGLSGKKRNTPLFVQNAFKEMLDVLAKVDDPKGFDSAREEISEIVHRVLDRLDGKPEPYSPEELAFRVQLTKKLSAYGDVKPQHVRAAMMSPEEMGPGSLVEYIKTKDRDGVIPVSLAQDRSFWIDKEKYIDTLKSVFEQVLDAVGLNFDSLMGFTTLDEFF